MSSDRGQNLGWGDRPAYIPGRSPWPDDQAGCAACVRDELNGLRQGRGARLASGTRYAACVRDKLRGLRQGR